MLPLPLLSGVVLRENIPFVCAVPPSTVTFPDDCTHTLPFVEMADSPTGLLVPLVTMTVLLVLVPIFPCVSRSTLGLEIATSPGISATILPVDGLLLILMKTE